MGLAAYFVPKRYPTAQLNESKPGNPVPQLSTAVCEEEEAVLP